MFDCTNTMSRMHWSCSSFDSELEYSTLFTLSFVVARSSSDDNAVCYIGNESVPESIITNAIKLFLNAITFLVISNHHSFPVLFDKIASVYFI